MHLEAKKNNTALIAEFQNIVGRRNVLTSGKAMEPYCSGYRSGSGPALCVVLPRTLFEQWRLLKAAVSADKIVIMQAANTGLTEGSTPNGTYDRDTVILSTRRLKSIHVINGGMQVISFAGSTLFDLEKTLLPLGRIPHSVIGSSCIGASIIGGICNNSGGALIERGPAYTEQALFAKINADGELDLVNHLGIRLGNDPETIFKRLENFDYSEANFQHSDKQASDKEYLERVRDIDAITPARFNGDARRLYEASGCAGKLAVFAVRLDTYPAIIKEKVFYVGTNEPAAFTKLRRRVLSQFKSLPVSGEYMHKQAYDISKFYGKDSLILIDKIGTKRLPLFFAMKGWIDACMNKIPILPRNLSDRVMQALGKLLPNPLPARIEVFRERFDHYLILKMQGDGIAEARTYLEKQQSRGSLDWFECSSHEAKIVGLHRFVAAGAAIRYQAVHAAEVEEMLPLDIALRRNDQEWFETLPEDIEEAVIHKLYYGHFFCHVLHQDYIIKKGFDPKMIKNKMLKILDRRGARYPAEHNVGHLYAASDEQTTFFQQCDPTNSLNPGIGKTSKKKFYG